MIRAHVTDTGWGDVRITIIAHPAEGSTMRPYVLRLGTGSVRLMEDLAEPPVVIDPTFTLSDDEGRALLDGLTRYYHGAEDTRALRRDYDDERGRVDKLTDAVLDVLKGRMIGP